MEMVDGVCFNKAISILIELFSANRFSGRLPDGLSDFDGFDYGFISVLEQKYI